MSLFSRRLMADVANRRERSKSERDGDFAARDYAYAPGPHPGSWRLRLSDVPGGPPTAARVGAALKSVEKRSERSGVPAADAPVVRRRLVAACRKAGLEVPEALRAAASEFDVAVKSAAEVFKDCCYEGCDRYRPPIVLFTDEVDGHQHSIQISLDPDSYEFHGGWMSHATSEGADNGHSHEWKWGPGGTVEVTMSSGHRHSVDLAAVLSELVRAR